MSVKAAIKKEPPRYRSPTRTADAEISLDEFTDAELRAEYAHRKITLSRNDQIVEDGSLYIEKETVERLLTLFLCGQKKYAVDELIELLNECALTSGATWRR